MTITEKYTVYGNTLGFEFTVPLLVTEHVAPAIRSQVPYVNTAGELLVARRAHLIQFLSLLQFIGHPRWVSQSRLLRAPKSALSRGTLEPIVLAAART